MGVAANRERGINVENHAIEKYPVEAASDDRCGWHGLQVISDITTDLTADEIVKAGTPVECKSCWDQYDARRGRWWIQRHVHERLLEAEGAYILVVVDNETSDVLRMALLDAATIDAEIDGGWWQAGDGGQTAGEYRQLPWSTIFTTPLTSTNGGGE
jgi:hypothetical protein